MLRKALEIKPGARFAVYARNNTIVIKACELPDLEKKWSRIFEAADRKSPKLLENDAYTEIQTLRAHKTRNRQD